MASRKRHHQDRHLKIRSVRKNPPDLRKIASALIALAMAQNEADAQAAHGTAKRGTKETPDPGSDQKGVA